MERKTKIIVFIIVALAISLTLLIVTLMSMKKNDESPQQQEINEQEIRGSITYDPISSVLGQINDTNDLSESPFVGVFENSYVAFFSSDAKDIFGFTQAGEPPYLTISDEGEFTLVINAYEVGMLAVRGRVAVDGDTAEFIIETKPAVDYFGSEIESFSMRLIGKNDMRYSGERLGTITKGDIFSRVTE